MPVKPAEADQVAMRGKGSVCEFREEKNSESRGAGFDETRRRRPALPFATVAAGFALFTADFAAAAGL